MTPDPARLRAASLALLTGAGQSEPHPRAVGQKFDASGRVLPFPGNTFLCHIPADGAAHAALCQASLALQAGPLADAFSFLPPSSFHMTVFEGVTDADRSDERWPEAMPSDAKLQAVTDRFAAATSGLALPRAQVVRPVAILGGGSVAVTGLTAKDEASLRLSRQHLRDATGIKRRNFASYGFHVTLAYPLRWLTADEAEAVTDLSEQALGPLCEAAPMIPLGPIEFCVFADMHAFHPLQMLDGKGAVATVQPMRGL